MNTTVLVSALVAAVTTLGIEFLAKPRLEVRKERIVESHRRRRTVMTHWRALERGIGRLVERVRQEAPLRHDGNDLHASMGQHVAGLRAAIETSDRELRDLEVGDMLEVLEAWDHYENVRGGKVGYSSNPGNYHLDQLVKAELQPLSERTFELIAVPRWRRRKRRQVRARTLYWEP